MTGKFLQKLKKCAKRRHLRMQNPSPQGVWNSSCHRERTAWQREGAGGSREAFTQMTSISIEEKGTSINDVRQFSKILDPTYRVLDFYPLTFALGESFWTPLPTLNLDFNHGRSKMLSWFAMCWNLGRYSRSCIVLQTGLMTHIMFKNF